MRNLLLVCLGGALGSGARYLISILALRFIPTSLPVGTLAVNLLGCFLISAILAVSAEASALSPATRLFLTTGIMGGLTTYSAFNHELLRFAQRCVSSIASRATCFSTVDGTHWSSTIMMSEPIAFCVAMLRSGLSTIVLWSM